MKHPKHANSHIILTTKLFPCLAAAILLGASASARAEPGTPPDGYYRDAYALQESAGCKQTFSGGIFLPKPSSTIYPHEYVLLLVFDNPIHSRQAGQKLFNADPKESPSMHIAHCMADPDENQHNDTGEGRFGLMVKGDCPSDCGALDLSVRGRNFVESTEPNPDPLCEIEGHPHWGILLVDQKGQLNSKASDVRVWQILVKDAAHASRILKKLEDQQLSRIRGYKGHLLIGHTPDVGDNSAQACGGKNKK